MLFEFSHFFARATFFPLLWDLNPFTSNSYDFLYFLLRGVGCCSLQEQSQEQGVKMARVAAFVNLV